MTSTASTSLRLELMATGDQSGTWGDTTNTNLGTLLEQAITGVLSVAEGDATLTLTNTDYVSNQARNAVIDLTGAMTAARNLVVPTAKKLYLIKNSTTGGFIVTVKTVAGTGVEVGPLTSRWVYCDGTNVVDGRPIFLGYTTTATAAGTTTLTVGSNRYQYATGVLGQTYTMPVTSTLVLGQDWVFVNNSTGALTINSSGANLIATVASGDVVTVRCILLTGTTAASWDYNTPRVVTSTDAGATAGPIQKYTRFSASPAFNDIGPRFNFAMYDNTATERNFAYFYALASTVNPAGGSFIIGAYGASGEADILSVGGGGVNPTTDATITLGIGTKGYTQLALASGGLISIGNANWVATHTTGILTVGTGDLRITTAGTNTASVVTVGGTQTFTGKTYDTAGAGNSFLINGLAATANTGTGSVVRATSPALTTPALGVATATSVAFGAGSAIALLDNGLYTPTLTNTTNLDSSTAVSCQWMQVGTCVTVSGTVTVDPTAAANTVMGFSLPVASNLGAVNHLGGTAASAAGEVWTIYGDLTNDRASFQCLANSTASHVISFSFTYRVI